MGPAQESLMAVQADGIQTHCRSTDIGIDRTPFIMKGEMHPLPRLEGKFALLYSLDRDA